MTQDLTIHLQQGRLNIRVAVWIEHEDMILASSFPNNLSSLPGGRVKFNETSYEAAIREIQEETGEQLEHIQLFAIIENFYTLDVDCHEILYVYRGSIPYKAVYIGTDYDDQTLSWLPKTELHKLKPLTFAQLAQRTNEAGVIHIINRDAE